MYFLMNSHKYLAVIMLDKGRRISMKAKPKLLRNAFADLDRVPPAMLSTVYKMPGVADRGQDLPVTGLKPESTGEEAGPKTIEDFRYDIIMSWMHDNSLVE